MNEEDSRCLAPRPEQKNASIDLITIAFAVDFCLYRSDLQTSPLVARKGEKYIKSLFFVFALFFHFVIFFLWRSIGARPKTDEYEQMYKNQYRFQIYMKCSFGLVKLANRV